MPWYWPFEKKTPLNESQKLTPVEPSHNEEQLDPHLVVQSEALAKLLRESALGNISDYQVSAAYASIYTKVADTRKKLMRDVDKMRSFYMVDVILNQITEDALAPEIGTGNILEVSSKKPEIQKEIDLLEERYDLDQLVLAIVPDLLAYGEYTLATRVIPSSNAGETVRAPYKSSFEGICENASNETGLLEIHDTVEQGSVIAITRWNQIEGYLVQEGGVKIVRKEPADFIKFSLASHRMRIDIHREYGVSKTSIPEVLQNLPRYIRVGRSIVYPVISKLKELELLEALVPATKLSKLSSGTILGVKVPTGYDIEKGLEAAKQVEQMINRKVGIDPKLGELTIENIMSSAGRMKAVPIFGDKGELSKLDYKSEEPDDLLNSVNDIRKAILTSVGIPYELVFGGEDKRGEILKKYSRYLRKLKNVQKSIEEGVRQIIYIHLANKGIPFIADDIKVEFYNKLVELDNLDKLEFSDTTIGMLANVKNFIMDLSNPQTSPQISNHVRIEGFLKYLNEQLNIIGFTDIIDFEVEKAKFLSLKKSLQSVDDQPSTETSSQIG